MTDTSFEINGRTGSLGLVLTPPFGPTRYVVPPEPVFDVSASAPVGVTVNGDVRRPRATPGPDGTIVGATTCEVVVVTGSRVPGMLTLIIGRPKRVDSSRALVSVPPMSGVCRR